MDTVSEVHAETPQPILSEGLAQGPYVAARAGVEPMTLRTKGVNSTNGPPCPTKFLLMRKMLHTCLQTVYGSASQTFFCRLPVTSNAEAAQPFAITCRLQSIRVYIKCLHIRCIDLWNSFPLEIRIANNLFLFKKRLRTYLLSASTVV